MPGNIIAQYLLDMIAISGSYPIPISILSDDNRSIAINKNTTVTTALALFKYTPHILNIPNP